MPYKTVTVDVDVDLDDILEDVDTEDLEEELSRRTGRSSTGISAALLNLADAIHSKQHQKAHAMIEDLVELYTGRIVHFDS